MSAHPTPEELEEQLADLQRQLQEQAEQDAAERHQLAATLDGLAQQLASVEALEQQVRELQTQLDQARAQPQQSQPPQSLPGPPPPKKSRRRLVVASTAGLGLVLGLALGLQHQLQQRDPTAAPQPAATAVLELQADQPSWLEVRSNTGQKMFVGELQGSKRFALGSGLQVLAGRPDLVTVRLGDMPPRPLGRIEDVDWHRFAPTGSAAQSKQQTKQGQEQSDQRQN